MFDNQAKGGSTRVADTIARALHNHGVRHAFGMPGGEVVTLIDGLQKAGIAFHLARHETAAAIMASGASVISGKLQMLVTTVGPGLANAVNGIADAAQERVPLIVISGIVDRATRARYTHQVINHAQLLQPLVKASFEVEPESAASTVARAIALAMADPMGPVHLDLSPAVAEMTVQEPFSAAPPQVLRPMVTTTDPSIMALSDRFKRAERPLIVAGFEAARRGANTAVLALAEATGAPVITTYKAKGLIPENHHLSLGGAGLSPRADAILLPLVASADLVLAIGYDPIEMRLGWLDFVKDATKLVEITGTAPDHAMHHAGTRVVADIARFVGMLAHSATRRRTWVRDEPAFAKAKLRSLFAGRDDWGPHAIIETLQSEIQDDTIVTVDSGAHRILLSQQWVARRPLTLLQSAGFCTMAAALPLAIGAKVAAPDRSVFAVMGDGGLEMGIGELATLRDLGQPITIVLFQDQSLALIALKQAAAGLAPAGVALGLTDFAAVTKGFGGYGINVETINDFRNELTAARTRAGFTLICCRFAASAYEDAF
ncbi:acetolactate synthase-1/2/3 large subunit [Rhizobium petrolearium]|uniref:thiamine pyrophosphate-binding protein n=1 Tax=Neorhizobium petrolearium TaxID=515361 RepID=UPI001AE40F1C|nr:thiamine pyrophosphate-binding protein [Neorhizobium petrolearium]MBP1846504.1 acetolactate synthase-1/2/3 large subunit [Neorhizobium petrolearium]